MWEKELEIAKELAVEAGKAIMEIYNKVDIDVMYKEDHSPLTVADQTSNEIIEKELRLNFPNYAILSEEGKDDLDRLENEKCFIIDPLDGTKEFIKRNGQFTVNIALAYKNHVEMGVIYAPAIEKLYYASKNDGAYKVDMSDAGNKVQKLKVSTNMDTPNLRVVMSSSHGCEEMDRLIEKYQLEKFVKMGSSLKGCLVAEGEADVYYRHNYTMEWDTAAMQCIVEEAGGIFRQMDNSEMLYNRVNSLNEKGFYAINNRNNYLT